MMDIRKSKARGYVKQAWLESYHTFSFADYYDPAYMGYSVLRVINEDVILPAQGFGMHPHRNMEIITYMLSGALRHEDSLGHGGVIQAGDVQHMTAGKGIVHSEANALGDQSAHLLQIWILPETMHLQPSYEQTHFSVEQKTNQFCLIASRKGEKGALKICQEVNIYATILANNSAQSLEFKIGSKRCIYVQLATGDMEVNGQKLNAGDAFTAETGTYNFKTQRNAEFLLFDLPIVD